MNCAGQLPQTTVMASSRLTLCLWGLGFCCFSTHFLSTAKMSALPFSYCQKYCSSFSTIMASFLVFFALASVRRTDQGREQVGENELLFSLSWTISVLYPSIADHIDRFAWIDRCVDYLFTYLYCTAVWAFQIRQSGANSVWGEAHLFIMKTYWSLMARRPSRGWCDPSRVPKSGVICQNRCLTWDE